MASLKTVIDRIGHHYRPWLPARDIEAKMKEDAKSGEFGFGPDDVPTLRGISNMVKKRRARPESPIWQPVNSRMSSTEISEVLAVLRTVVIESEGKVLNFSVMEAQAIRMVVGVVPTMSPILVYLLARDLLSKEDTTTLDLFLAFSSGPPLSNLEKEWMNAFANMRVDWPVNATDSPSNEN